VRKAWRQLNREGITVATCTVARLMAEKGLAGTVRGIPVRTTRSNPATPCPAVRVNRQLQASRPNALRPSDFTDVATWSGLVYAAFCNRRHRSQDCGLARLQLHAGRDRAVGRQCERQLRQSVIGLFETEAIRRRGPWHGLDAIVFATLDWINWVHNRRPIGNIPPAEAKARYYTATGAPNTITRF